MPTSHGPRYDDDYAYNPPSNPPPSYTKTAHRHQDQYEMVERKNISSGGAFDANGPVSLETFFAEVSTARYVPCLF
jgi:syntaxin 1B/2/3